MFSTIKQSPSNTSTYLLSTNMSSKTIMSVQIVACPAGWTEDSIVELFRANLIGQVRQVKFVKRKNGSVSAYVDLYCWYSNDAAENIIWCLMHDSRQVHVKLWGSSIGKLLLRNIPKRAAKISQIKQDIERKANALSDAIDFEEMWSESHNLVLREQASQTNEWSDLACICRF